jgi:putative PEP-CTERM system TPR-repeat lipoprotein
MKAWLKGMMLLFVVGLMLSACGEGELSDVEYLQRAKQQQAQNNLFASIIELKNALKKNQANMEARLLLGEVYVQVGDGASAEKELLRAQQLGLTGAMLQRSLIEAFLLQKKYQSVLDGLKIPDGITDAEEAMLFAMRGDAHLGLGEFSAAKNDYKQSLKLDAKSIRANVGLAKLALLRKDYQGAAKIIEAAEKIDSKAPLLLQVKGSMAFQQSRYSDAEHVYNQLLQTQPSGVLLTRYSSQARIGLAYSLLAQDKDQEAVEHIDALLKANKKHLVPNYLKALVSFKAGQYKDAVDRLQPIVADMGPSTPAKLLLGAANYALGQYEQAAYYLAQYNNAVPNNIYARKLYGATRLKLNQPEQAADILTPLLSLLPDDAKLLDMIGVSSVMRGDFTEGRHYFEKAMSQSGEALNLKIAETFMAEGDYDAAIQELEKTVRGSPEELRSKLLLVLAYLQKRDMENALKFATNLVEERPEDPVAQNLLGGVHLVRGENEQAAKHFQAALAVAPRYIPALMNAAQLALQDGRLKEAQDHYATVLGIEEQNVSAILGSAYIAEKQGNQSQAINLLERARLADPNAMQPRLHLASYYLRSQQLDKAKVLANEAVAIKSDDVAALLMLGDVALADQRAAEAVSAYMSVIKIAPKSATARVRLSQAYTQQGKLSNARDELRKALAIDPDLYSGIVALAVLEMKAGNNSQAFKLASDLQKRHPNASEGFVLEGDLHWLKGEYRKAVAAYEAASQREQSVAIVLKEFKARKGDKLSLAAIQPLRDWLEQNPTDTLVRKVLAGAFQDMGRNQDAIAQFRRVNQEQPNDPNVLNNLAWLLFLQGEAEAIKYAKSAYELGAQDPAIADTYGWLLVQNGEYQRGYNVLKEIDLEKNQLPEMQYHLAFALEKMGRRKEAYNLLERLLDASRGFAFQDKPEAEALFESLKGAIK